MSPAGGDHKDILTSFPRVSGDEPRKPTMSPTVGTFSPRERG